MTESVKLEPVEAARRLYRALEMSAGIMRAPKRTGGWEGAERTANAFERQAEAAKALYDTLRHQPQEREGVLEEVARLVEKRSEQRFDEYGTREPDTNATYYSGRAGELYESLDEEDEDIAKAIRALKTTPAPAVSTDEIVELVQQIATGASLGSKMFVERVEQRKGRLTWYAVNVLQDNLAACEGSARAILSRLRGEA